MVHSIIKKDLIGYEETHYCTSDGKIYRKDFTCFRVHKGTDTYQPLKGRELVGKKLSPKGYKRVSVKCKVHFVHSLIAKTFIPNPENKPQVNHINGIKTDNRVENLEWVTNQENRNHAMKNNLQARGESLKRSSLKEKDILEIRKLYKQGMLQKDIACLFSSNQRNISKIVRNETWTHI